MIFSCANTVKAKPLLVSLHKYYRTGSVSMDLHTFVTYIILRSTISISGLFKYVNEPTEIFTFREVTTGPECSHGKVRVEVRDPIGAVRVTADLVSRRQRFVSVQYIRPTGLTTCRATSTNTKTDLCLVAEISGSCTPLWKAVSSCVRMS